MDSLLYLAIYTFVAQILTISECELSSIEDHPEIFHSEISHCKFRIVSSPDKASYTF